MEVLQNLRTQAKELYRIHGVKIVMLFKIILLAITIFKVNGEVGSIDILENPVISILIAVIAGVLPTSLGVTIVAAVALAHVFEISMMVAGIVLLLIFLLGIFSLRLAPDSQCVGLVSFVIASVGGSFAAPVVLVLGSTVSAVVPMLSGLISYRVLSLISGCREALVELTMIEGTLEFVQVLADDKYLLSLIIVTGLSYIAASYIKMVDAVESWKVALVVCVGVNVAMAFLLEMLMNTKMSIMSVAIWSCVGLAIGLIIEFMIHNVNYKATEVLNFEDDEFFYYVKAVPKKVKDPAPNVSDSKLGKKSIEQSKKNKVSSNANKNNSGERRSRNGSSSHKKDNTRRNNTNKNTTGNKTRNNKKRR